jgi:hypothetical protein
MSIWYEFKYDTAFELSKQAAEDIWKDLICRGGVGNVLDNCTKDVQQEIKDMMAEIILAQIDATR